MSPHPYARQGHAFCAQYDTYPASCERLLQRTAPDRIHPAKTQKAKLGQVLAG